MELSGSGLKSLEVLLAGKIFIFYVKRRKGKMVATGVMPIEDKHQAKAVEEQS